MAALDLGAGVQQPFDCLIVQNRQAVQSMRRSMDSTLENNLVGLFCVTLTGRRGGHTSLVQARAETPDTGVETVKDPGSSWESHSGGWVAGVGDENAVLWGCPPNPHSIGDPPSAPHQGRIR